MKKAVAILLVFLLNFLTPGPLFYALPTLVSAQEELTLEPDKSPIPTTEPSPTPTDEPSTPDTIKNVSESTPAPSPESTESDWIKIDDSTDKTKDPVAEGKDYNFRETKVGIRFNKITTPGYLTVREIKLSEEEQARLGALSDTAYDISSDMENGTFNYDLTLPNPDLNQNASVMLSEDGNNYQTTESEKQNETIIAKNLDHFTIFVIGNGTPPPSVFVQNIIDNSDPEFEVLSGIWRTSTSVAGWYGSNYETTDDRPGGAQVRWNFVSPLTGTLEVFTRWTSTSNRGTAVPFTVNSDSGDATINVNQEADGGTWVSLGTFPFTAGNNYSVILTNNATNSADYVIGDAIMVRNTTEPISTPTIISPPSNTYWNTAGLTLIDWTGSVGSSGPIQYQYRAFADAGYTSNIYTSGWLAASQIPTPGTPSGNYYVQVRAKDTYLDITTNWSNDSSNPYKITVENIAPVTTDSGTDSNWHNTNVAISLSCTDNLSGCAQTYYTTDGSNPTTSSATGNTVVLNSDGIYTIKYFSVDNAGNKEVVKTAANQVKIDKTVPLAPTITSPSPEQYFNTTPILNSWTTVSDTSGISYYRVQYEYDDHHAFSGYPYRTTINNYRNHTPALTEQGGVSFRVQAFDNAGNQGEWSDWRHYFYDATAPGIPTLISPANNAFVLGFPSLTNSWSFVPDASKYIYESYNDSGATSLRYHGEYTTTSKTAYNVADAIFWWRVKTVDLANNVSGWSDLWKVTVDNTAPTGNWITPFSGDTISGTANLEVNASDSLSGVASVQYQYSSDGVTFFDIGAPITSGPYTTSWDTTLLPLGPYTIQAVITDNAGNSTNIDEVVDVAAVITDLSGVGNSTDQITITWNTDRPTDSRVVFDTVGHPSLDRGHAPNYDFSFSSGTLDSGGTTSHTVVLTGLNSGTTYYFKAVSSGVPSPTIAISDQTFALTLGTTGAPGPSGASGPQVAGVSITSNPIVLGDILGINTYTLSPSPSPEPTVSPSVAPTTSPEVLGANNQSFNWWYVAIPGLGLFLLLLFFLLRRKKSESYDN